MLNLNKFIKIPAGIQIKERKKERKKVRKKQRKKERKK